ncbi:hypothetical protein F444_14992 [Phytophthora nicotianae P1976]|uniref:SWIM-type domain-containing protein n=1 Tax=Phytophthora nicotianae P1976 TaxID=1317066 RepID=A0A080ZNE7_PHYNI|nr:hypothetical protein F444_14992 [Phytophthora nicotianae P1976]
MIKPDVYLLKSSRTHAQFLKLAVVVIETWIARGEDAYAQWFKDVYLTERWNRWHINGAAVGGITPSQQGIESHHCVIKKTCVPSSRASTTGVLNGILPHILKAGGENLCPNLGTLYCEGPLPPEMLAKAAALTSTARNYKKVFSGRGRNRQLTTIVFNVSKHIVGSQGLLGTDIDQACAVKFLHSLKGRLSRGFKANEVKFELLSLHRVLIMAQTLSPRFELAPIWRDHIIQQIRQFLHCTCESFVRSGWICSHAIATLSLLGLLGVDAAMASVPVRRTPGRPRARRLALTEESTQDGFYDVDRLLRLFIDNLGSHCAGR